MPTPASQPDLLNDSQLDQRNPRKWVCFHTTTDNLKSIFPVWPALQGMAGLFLSRILWFHPR